ncbi:MAG: sodium:solute symporter family protein, partial [Tepidisphaeraceae bacterium]
MTLGWFDWLIVLVPIAIVVAVAMHTRRYMHGVADFLAGGRAAGRYLVANAADAAGMGAVSVVALFEQTYHSGFVLNWWGALYTPVLLTMTLLGFVLYRYRETRVMTLAQFFEVRYSRRFRIFAGLLCAVSGILNYAIFPAVGARFFVAYCGWPQTIAVAGHSIETFIPLMALLLGAAASVALLGGQLTAMVLDCVEGMISSFLYLVVAAALLYLVPWSRMSATLATAPPGHSMLNPFDSGEVKDFNIWFVLIGIGASIYLRLAWQGNQGFNCSALNAHEAKMGSILGAWRGYAKLVMITLLALCAFTFMNNPIYAAGAEAVHAQSQTIADPQIREQMLVPVALGHLLPAGIKGAFCSIMLLALLACDGSYLHSWGSIVVQDVVLPFRREPLSPKQHIFWLRCSIFGVALFAFVFSSLFRMTDYILMYFAITGAIFLGGAGSVIIGGLYWKKATPAAAWAAMITGSGLSVGGIVLQQTIPDFPINGTYASAISMGSSILVFVVVSLVTCRRPFDLDRMLHRGPWVVPEDAVVPTAKPGRLASLMGIDENFTRADRFQAGAFFAWTIGWFVVFIVVTVWNLVHVWPTGWWSHYWYWAGTLLPLGVGVVTTVWFTLGGVRDIRNLFRRLSLERPDASDDGTVVTGHNADEVLLPVSGGD